MNIKQLNYFVEVAKQKSFTKASGNLYICQSALSKTIKQLEGDLGVQLIDRTAKTFKLTPEGKIFYENGQMALKNINDELNGLYDSIHAKKGKISVGIPPVIGTAYFTKIVYEFRNMYPDIVLHVVEAGANTVKDKVEAGEIDIGVVILPFSSNNFNITPVIKGKNVLIVHKDHPLARRKNVAFKELCNEQFISLDQTFMLYDRIVHLCESAGFKPNIVCESTQWDFVAEMVALKQGISILPKPILKKLKTDDIRMIDLIEPEFPWDVALIVKDGKYMSNEIRYFIDLVEAEGKKIS